MTQHRCFLAAPVPGELIKPLRMAARAALSGEEWNLVPDDNLHLTLVFLGALDSEAFRRAISVLHAVALPSQGRQHLSRIGGFPGAGARILAAEGSPSQATQQLHERLCERLREAGLPCGDQRRLRPHITLAKRPRGGQSVSEQACDLCLPVREVVLYESVQPGQGSGVIYQPIARRILD
jgi:2'-5' RNA ligase